MNCATLGEAVATSGQVVEGVRAARAVRTVAMRLAIDMPICSEVYAVLHEGRGLAESVSALMQRELKAEASAASGADLSG